MKLKSIITYTLLLTVGWFSGMLFSSLVIGPGRKSKAVYERSSILDPKETTALFTQMIREVSDKRASTTDFISAAGTLDRASFVELCYQLLENDQLPLLETISVVWADRYPNDAMGFIFKAGMDNYPEIAQRIFITVSERDFSLAESFALRIDNTLMRSDYVRGMSNPYSPSSMVPGEYEENSDSWSPVKSIYAHLAGKDLERAMALSQKIADIESKENAIRGIVRSISDDSFDDALQWASSQSSKEMQLAGLKETIGLLAEKDPQRAAEELAPYLASEAFNGSGKDIFKTWIKKDAPGAVEWMMEKIPLAQRKSFFESIELVGSLEQAEQIARLLAPTGDRAAASSIARAIEIWGTQDPESLLGWVTQSSENPQVIGTALAATVTEENFDANFTEAASKPDALESFLKLAVTKFPKKAIESLEQSHNHTQLPVLDLSHEAILRISRSDPEAAAKWVDESSLFSDAGPKVRAAMLGPLIKNWASTDIESAGEWVESLDMNENKDISYNVLASVQTGDNNLSALQWATRIRDPRLRMGRYAQIASQMPASELNTILSKAGVDHNERDQITKRSRE